MASLPPSLYSFLVVSVALILISISSSFSPSQALDDHHSQSMNTGFKATLNNIDSGGTLTERFQRAMERGKHRHRKVSEMLSKGKKHQNITATVYPGTYEYLMNLSIGTPPKSYYAIMDTGSDLIWTQCKPCVDCFSQPTPLFDPKKSSSFKNLSCSSKLCKALPISFCQDGCQYMYSYGGGAFTRGFLASETFTFEKVSIPNIGFGCGEFDEGVDQGAGLVGLGRGPLSLVSQLGEPKFSYCLTSVFGSKPSTLLLGSQASVNRSSGGGETKTTPLIRNSQIPTFYYISLEGITVGGTKLPINNTTFALYANGTGGLIVDSGTTITYLVESAFTLVKKAFISQVKLPVSDKPNPFGLDLCFKLPSSGLPVVIPQLVFHFKDTGLVLPVENYMIANSSMGITCLAMGASFGFSIFGNIQQQNMLVVYDLYKETLSFTPTEC